MAQPAKRAQPATHVSVWIGLGLSIVGLLVAMYAYSGTRVYDITYAFVALVGGLAALAGIMVSAWGRAIMAARAQRNRRATLQKDALMVADAGIAERPPPTVAEPAEKKRFALPFKNRKPKQVVEGEASSGTLFAFKSRAAEPQPEPRALEIPAIESLVEAPLQMEAAAPAVERVTLKCPSCATQFTTEGVRPLTATCPACGFSATV
ncbi:MAG: hypothetical protein QOE90_2936 [Thermoplasmata archaeon]|nr:hypothetical protein [Thermoplasmata archaeon]